MTIVDPNRDWKTLLSYLPCNFRELAREHKQLETQYGNAVITTAEELLRLILLHVGANMPLRQTAALMAEGGGPVISPNRIHMKMRRAAPYLAALVAAMTTSWRTDCELQRCGGYELVVVDGTAFSGRCATGTDARIHTAIRLSDLSIFSAHATGVEVGESLKRFHLLPGQLVIGDRGYSNAPGIVHAVERGADVLVRLNRGALPLFDRDDEPFVVEPFLREIEEEQLVERAVRVSVWIDGHLRVVDGRLIATRLPADKAQEARERVRQEMGAKLTDEAWEMAAYVALFTTAPKSKLTAHRSMELYRLRWQIELLFKRWKTLCHFDRLPNERPDTILSWLYAKILLGLVLDRIAAAAPPLSPPVQLACYDRAPLRAQSRKTLADRQRSVEAHEHRLARNRRSAAASDAA